MPPSQVCFFNFTIDILSTIYNNDGMIEQQGERTERRDGREGERGGRRRRLQRLKTRLHLGPQGKMRQCQRGTITPTTASGPVCYFSYRPKFIRH